MHEVGTPAEKLVTNTIRDLIVMGRIPQGGYLSGQDCIDAALTYLKETLSQQQYDAIKETSRNSGRIPIKTMIAEGLMTPESKGKKGEGGRVVFVTMDMVRRMIMFRWNTIKMIVQLLCVDRLKYEWLPGPLLATVDRSEKFVNQIEVLKSELDDEATTQRPELDKNFVSHMRCCEELVSGFAEAVQMRMLEPLLLTSFNIPRLLVQRTRRWPHLKLERLKQVNRDWRDMINAVTAFRKSPNSVEKYLNVERIIDQHFREFVATYFGDPDRGDEHIDLTTFQPLRFAPLPANTGSMKTYAADPLPKFRREKRVSKRAQG